MNVTTTFIFAFVIALVKGTNDYFDSSEADARSAEAEIITKRNNKLDDSEITLIERSGENMKTDTILSSMETLKESPLVLRTSDLSRESMPTKTDEPLLEGRSNEPTPELSKSAQEDDKSGVTEVSSAVEGRSDTNDSERERVGSDSERVGNSIEDNKTTEKVTIEERNAEEHERTDGNKSKSSDESNLNYLQNRRMMSDTDNLMRNSKASSHTQIEEKSGQTSQETFLRITPKYFDRINNCCKKNSMNSFNPSPLPIPQIANPFLISNTIPKNINQVTNGYNTQLQHFFNPSDELRPLQEMTTLQREMINAYNEYPFGTTTSFPSLDRIPYKDLLLNQGFPAEHRKLYEQNSEKYYKSFPRVPLPTYQPPQTQFLYTFLPVV